MNKKKNYIADVHPNTFESTLVRGVQQKAIYAKTNVTILDSNHNILLDNTYESNHTDDKTVRLLSGFVYNSDKSSVAEMNTIILTEITKKEGTQKLKNDKLIKNLEESRLIAKLASNMSELSEPAKQTITENHGGSPIINKRKEPEPIKEEEVVDSTKRLTRNTSKELKKKKKNKGSVFKSIGKYVGLIPESQEF